MQHKTLEERMHAKWKLQAKSPIIKPGCVEYTPEMIAWQEEYNTFMEENFDGRVDIIIVPFIEMPEYKDKINTLKEALRRHEGQQPRIVDHHPFWGDVYEDFDAGVEYLRKWHELNRRINDLEEEARVRTYGASLKGSRKFVMGDDVWDYDEYIKMVL